MKYMLPRSATQIDDDDDDDDDNDDGNDIKIKITNTTTVKKIEQSSFDDSKWILSFFLGEPFVHHLRLVIFASVWL